MNITAKRVYDDVAPKDGMRVLVDRLWPRGFTKERLRADVWMKDLAPSTELRKWFKSGDGDWAEFKRRYIRELDANPDAVDELKRAAKQGKVTLLYSVADPERNHARILIDYLERKSR